MQTQNPKTSSNSVEQCIGNSLNLDCLEEENDQKASYIGKFMGSSSTLIGDYIGIESCLDLVENNDIFASPSLSSSKQLEDVSESSLSQRRRRERDQKWGKMKEFPPPIPLLARTENLPSHMPWVLKRYYTDDGRLILREERVKRHEYFKAQRCNGRLILHLVPLDDEVYPPCLHNQENDREEEETVDCSSVEEEEEEECDINGNCSNENIENEVVYHEDQSSSLIGGNVSAFKCFNCNTTRQLGSTCIFDQMSVPALRPVHS